MIAPGDPESAQYSGEIAHAIAEVGKLHESTSHPKSAGSFTGRNMSFGLNLLRNTRDNVETSESVDRLLTLFRDAVLPTNEFTVEGMLPDILRLQVGYNLNMARELKSP